MSDELARKLGFTDSDIAELDRLCRLMADAPQPPDSASDVEPARPRRGFLRRAAGVLLYVLLVTIAGLAMWGLLRLAVWFGTHGMLPAPN